MKWYSPRNLLNRVLYLILKTAAKKDSYFHKTSASHRVDRPIKVHYNYESKKSPLSEFKIFKKCGYLVIVYSTLYYGSSNNGSCCIMGHVLIKVKYNF